MIYGDSIKAILLNFATYVMLHPEFRSDLLMTGLNVINGLQTDMVTDPLPYPPLYKMTIPE